MGNLGNNSFVDLIYYNYIWLVLNPVGYGTCKL